jgi:hypothetical protein
MMSARLKRSVTPSERIPIESLSVGLQVEAQDGDLDTQGIYFSGRISHIERTGGDPEQWRITVTFDKYHDTNTVFPSELRPHGWSDYSKWKPQESKRPRRQTNAPVDESAQTALSIDADTGSGPELVPEITTPQPPRSIQKEKDDGLVVVLRVFDDRPARNGGTEREFFCKLGDGQNKWLPRRPCLEDEDEKGVVTTVGALLAYEWAPWYIVQTQSDGEELLVAWKNRPPTDWAYVPPYVFLEKDLRVLREYKPYVTEESKQNATHRLFMGVQDCLRSTTERKKTLEHFPAYEIESVLGDLGTPVHQNPKPAHSGDRITRSFSREELDPLFRPYREKWDELRSSRGKLLGRIDFGVGRGVHIIWFARPSAKELYTSADGRETYLPLKHSAPYVECVKIEVCIADSTEEEDEAVVNNLLIMQVARRTEESHTQGLPPF